MKNNQYDISVLLEQQDKDIRNGKKLISDLENKLDKTDKAFWLLHRKIITQRVIFISVTIALLVLLITK